MPAHGKIIRTLVVDDEPLARNDLCTMLGAQQGFEVVGQCGNGRDAISAIRDLSPDLVFLDVQMPECDGFEVLERLGSKRPFAVVFVTAYDRYALRAFEAGALDYLLKPFDEARFRHMLIRVTERMDISRASALRQSSIAIKQVGEVIFVPIAQIDWIESADYYACLHADGKTHIVRRSLSDLEQDLAEEGFLRIHRSTIVNLARVARVTLSRDGEHQLELRDGKQLKLSRRYRRAVLDRLGV